MKMETKTNTDKGSPKLLDGVNYDKIELGKVDGRFIYLSPPSWDCDWYWGFGYLGNRDCHYHVSGLSKNEGVDMYDALKTHFGDSLVITEDKDIWTIAELFKTFYTLKETAELFHTGCSGLTSNPCRNILTNKIMEDRINQVIMPNIFKEIYVILNKYRS